MLVHLAREVRDLASGRAALQTGAIRATHAAELGKARRRSLLSVDSFRGYEEILVDLAEVASPDEVRAAAERLVEAEAPDRSLSSFLCK